MKNGIENIIICAVFLSIQTLPVTGKSCLQNRYAITCANMSENEFILSLSSLKYSTKVYESYSDCYTILVDNVTFSSFGSNNNFKFYESLEIKHNKQNISTEIFHNWNQLLFLNVYKSNIPIIQGFNFKSCDTLNLTSNNIHDIKTMCKNDCLINNIILKQNKIKLFTREHVSSCKEVRYLDLSYNELTFFSTDVFDSLNKLQILDLSNNKLQNFSNSLTSQPEFGYSSVEKLYLNNNNLSSLTQNTFKYLYNLRHLSLENNVFLQLEVNTFGPLQILSYLSVNNIKNIRMDTLGSLPFLFKLNMANGTISSIEEYSFKNFLYGLRTLNLQNNTISELVLNTFDGLHKLQNLYISHNPIKRIASGAFKSLVSVMYLDLSNLAQLTTLKKNQFEGLSCLMELSITNSSLEYLEKGAFNYLQRLRVLVLQHNKIKTLTCGISDSLLNYMTYLDLSYNEIGNIEICVFETFPNVTKLLLNNNQLSYLAGGTFSSLVRLETLNISNNLFKHFDVNVIHPLIKLRNLDVSMNEFITEFDPGSLISHFKYIQHVWVSENHSNGKKLVTDLFANKPENSTFERKNTIILTCQGQLYMS